MRLCAGDEEYVVIEGNLGIETLTTPYSLASDCQAATFWTATPKNIWRNNVAANSHGNGFWFELDAGAAGDFTKAPTIEVSGNNFHDNNLRGWFIAPKYLPETPQYFHGNTYTRNHMDGIFYGVGGDTHHVGDNFVSNSGNGDLLWWFFPSRESSRWIPNLKDVTFTGGKYNPGKGARRLPRPTAALFAPNQEFFLVDGAEFTDYEDGSAITQCFDCCGYRSRQGAYTTRFANLFFDNSARRTSYVCPEKQIFMDLDGSLTGDKAKGVAGDAGASVVAYHAFNEWDECPRADKKFSKGLVCSSKVRVRKLAIPINVNVPKVYAPVTNAGRQVYLKQSEMIDPMGFVAVFESNRVNSSGSVRPIEKSAILTAVAGFLGLDQRHVAETTMPAQAGKSQGIAVQIGGHLDVLSKNDDLGRKHVDVSHNGLCETGVIKADLLAYTGLCVDAYGKQVPLFAAHNKTDLTPEACIAWCQSYTQGTGCQHIPGIACHVVTAKKLRSGSIYDSYGNAKAVTLWQHSYKSGWEASFGVGAFRAVDVVAHGGRSNDASTIEVKAGYVATVYSHGDLTGNPTKYTAGRHGLRRNDDLSSIRVAQVHSANGQHVGWPSQGVAAKSTCWTMASVPSHPFVGCYVNQGPGGVRVCPQKGGRYEAHTGQANHGDLCRNSGRAWDCPTHCEFAPGKGRPYCVLKGSASPCRNTAPSMRGRTMEQCRAAAKEKGWSYFGLENPGGSPGAETGDCHISELRPKAARTKYTSSCGEKIDASGQLLGGAAAMALYQTYVTNTGGNVRTFRLQDYWGRLSVVGIKPKPLLCSKPAVVQPVCEHKHVPRELDEAAPSTGRLLFNMAASRGAASGYSAMSETDFNDAFEKSPSKIIVRVCSSCSASHKLIFYKRKTAPPKGWSLRHNLLHSWMKKNNVMDTDFSLHSSYSDALVGANPWLYCNYDDARVGMPRDCGPTGAVHNNWMTQKHHHWALYIAMGEAPANSTRIATNEFDALGSGTVCTVSPGTVLPEGSTFPIKAYAGKQQCKTWGDESTQYDAIDYVSSTWTRDTEHTKNFQRQRRDSDGTC